MRAYKYSAISKSGAKVTGVVEAFDEFAAVAQIKESCTLVTKIAEVEAIPKEHQDLFPPRLNEKNLAVLCSQFAIILGAGLPIVRAVELIADQTADKTLKRILKDAAGDVAAGFTLAQSLENKGRGLPVAFIETIRSGEESGTLDNSFRRLHSYYDKSSKIKGKARAAMTYPMFTIVVAVVVVAIIMVKAVPTFVNSFTSMGVDLPGVTLALIAVSNFFVHFWALLAALIAGGLLAWKLWGQSEGGRLWQHRFKLKLPVLGKLTLMKSASQFAGTMTTLLSAGLPMLRAVEITAKVLDNYYFATQIGAQLPKLEEGRALGECLRHCPLLPELLVEMTAVGEETGSLEHTLEVVGDYYDNETDLRSQKALSLLEPIIICVLAAVVCFILLAVYMPMFSLYASY
ncbi:MAG: type II secretion system F family protein [Oscillibacter sp.]